MFVYALVETRVDTGCKQRKITLGLVGSIGGTLLAIRKIKRCLWADSVFLAMGMTCKPHYHIGVPLFESVVS